MQYTLRQGRGTALVDTQGAELQSFTLDGAEYVWKGDPAFWSGHAPVLFPIVGRLTDDTVRIEGQAYSMRMHGFARHSESAVREADDGHITLELVPSEAVRSQYPYKFSLRTTHTLIENGFATAYEVENTDGRPIRFTIGGHPGFCCPIRGEGQFPDYEVVFEREEEPWVQRITPEHLADTSRLFPVPLQGRSLPLAYGLFDYDALVFNHLHSRSVRLQNRRTGKGLRFSFDGFCNFGIWTPTGKQAPFVCLEPWQGGNAEDSETGRFEDKPDVVTLAPGQTYRASYRVEIDA